MRKLKKTLLILGLLFPAFYIYDLLLLNNIVDKDSEDYLRIGYINLHENKISQGDLKRLVEYKCDMWLFLEWNGNNLDNYPAFGSAYHMNHEMTNEKTYGVSIFSKWTDVEVNEIDKENSPYACDYPKFLIKRDNLEVYLLHAPPPVPSCKFETGKYILDLIPFIDSTGNKATIIIGDLNSFPFQSGIREIKRLGFSDSHNQTSNWPQGTFGPFTWFPKILKFDYIFHNTQLEPIRVNRFSISTSDHSGWIVDYKNL